MLTNSQHSVKRAENKMPKSWGAGAPHKAVVVGGRAIDADSLPLPVPLPRGLAGRRAFWTAMVTRGGLKRHSTCLLDLPRSCHLPRKRHFSWGPPNEMCGAGQDLTHSLGQNSEEEPS